MRRYLVVLISAVGLSACLENKPCPEMNFERLNQTNRIVITDNMNKEIKTITDLSRIGEIKNFALSHSTGWETPWYGAPVALVRANFYVGEKFIGDFGVGKNFLSAQGCGFFQSREVSAKDRETILGLFAVKDPYEGR